MNKAKWIVIVLLSFCIFWCGRQSVSPKVIIKDKPHFHTDTVTTSDTIRIVTTEKVTVPKPITVVIRDTLRLASLENVTEVSNTTIPSGAIFSLYKESKSVNGVNVTLTALVDGELKDWSFKHDTPVITNTKVITNTVTIRDIKKRYYTLGSTFIVNTENDLQLNIPTVDVGVIKRVDLRKRHFMYGVSVGTNGKDLHLMRVQLLF